MPASPPGGVRGPGPGPRGEGRSAYETSTSSFFGLAVSVSRTYSADPNESSLRGPDSTEDSSSRLQLGGFELEFEAVNAIAHGAGDIGRDVVEHGLHLPVAGEHLRGEAGDAIPPGNGR